MPQKMRSTAGKREQQLEQIYVAYLRDANFWASQFRFSKEDYEDCVQDAWINAASHLADYDETVAQLRTWFHRILIHRIVDFKRRRHSGKQATNRLDQTVQSQNEAPPVDNPAPWWASGEYHVLQKECQKAVSELLYETNELLAKYAPAHKAAFDCIINDVMLKEIADTAGRSEESIGASLRRKRQEFIAALNSDTPLGERLRRVKGLAHAVAELRHLLDENLKGPAAPIIRVVETVEGDDE
jgi:RNA polymerase sigma factor (sigma-70 family)